MRAVLSPKTRSVAAAIVIGTVRVVAADADEVGGVVGIARSLEARDLGERAEEAREGLRRRGIFLRVTRLRICGGDEALRRNAVLDPAHERQHRIVRRIE